MWAPQIAGCFLVICTTSYSVPTTNLTEAAEGYQFGWTVRDDETGDYKTHHEEATGDGSGRGVRGEYMVGEPNGDLRVVSYSVAPGTGFRATVKVLPGGSPVGGSTIGGGFPVSATPSDKPVGALALVGLGQEEKLKKNKSTEALQRIGRPESERSEQAHTDHQDMGQQGEITDENKTQAAGQSEERSEPEQRNAEIKGPEKIATKELNGKKTGLGPGDGQKKEQTRPEKTGNSSKQEDFTTESSLFEKPIDILRDLPYADKHIHNVEYIVKEEHDEELQAKQNDFVASDFSRGNDMIVKVHENEADQNHDLLELASDTGVLQVGQGSGGNLKIDVGHLDMAVNNSSTSVDSKKLQSPMIDVTQSSTKSTPDRSIAPFAAVTSQSHVQPVIALTAQPDAAKTYSDHHSDHMKESIDGLKEIIDDSKDTVKSFDETSANSPVNKVMLAELMIPTSPVITFTCLPEETVKDGLLTGPTVSIGPTTDMRNPTQFYREPPKAFVTTSFPIFPFTMMNFGPTRFQSAAPLLPQSSEAQAGRIRNNFGLSTTRPQPRPTNTAQIDGQMNFKTRSNLQSDFSPAFTNGFYPGHLLPPPWVRAQHHHSPRHMPIFVLPMSHNVNFAPTFNPEMFGKHSQK